MYIYIEFKKAHVLCFLNISTYYDYLFIYLFIYLSFFILIFSLPLKMLPAKNLLKRIFLGTFPKGNN